MYFTQNQIPDLFHDAAKIDYYSKTEECCIYGFLISHDFLNILLPESILYLTHDSLKKFRMPILRQ